MASEYDPLRLRPPLSGDPSDLARVEELFQGASSRYLHSPWPWFSWAVILPMAAWLTARVATGAGPLAVLFLWSAAILLGGAVEGVVLARARRRAEAAGVGKPSELARWVFRSQGNVSVLAVVLTAALALRGVYQFLPGVWLLLIGHSLFSIGGLASPALRRAGLLYQVGGALSLLPFWNGLIVFAVTTALANASVGWALVRSGRAE